MNIAIIAASSGYQVSQLTPWVESLKASKFPGKVAVILYDNNEEVIKYLNDAGIAVVNGEKRNLVNIATQRFQDYKILLQSEHFSDVEYVIHTDIRDVIFQSDPSVWVKENIGSSKIMATSEGVTYRHEDWNGEGIQENFGQKMFNDLVDKETLCSGIIAGEKNAMIDLFNTIFELTFYSVDLDGFADQHFYNVAIYKIYKEITKIVPADDPWVANLGTLIAIPMNSPQWSSGPRTGRKSYERFRKGSFTENMLVELPTMVNSKVVQRGSSKPYAIVHQYDRYQPWASELLSGLGIKLNPAITERNFRNGWDKQIYNEVYLNNEYEVSELKSTDVIVDIGAHIGFFSRLCADKGSENVYSYEANPDNFKQLCLNVAEYKTIKPTNTAVWRSDTLDTTIKAFLNKGEENTGLSTTMLDAGVEVQTTSLQSILQEFDSIRLMKIDAEGSEHPILLTCNDFNNVQEIVGELHEYENLNDLSEKAKVPGYEKYTRSEIQSHLEKHGFKVTITPVEWSTQHAFFRATK